MDYVVKGNNCVLKILVKPAENTIQDDSRKIFNEQTELHASEFHALAERNIADPGKEIYQQQMSSDPYLVLLFIGLLFLAVALRSLLASQLCPKRRIRRRNE